MASLTDREILVGQAYATPAPLEARRAIYQWQHPARDLPATALSLLQGVTGPVIDVGCGPGHYWRLIARERPDLHVVGLDLSPGMRPHAIADAQHLPLPDRAAGAALAMHMLYHVPDIDRAIGEVARVLRDDGIAIIATNGAGHMRQLGQLFADAVRAVRPGAESPVPPPQSGRFRLDNATGMLRRRFAAAEPVVWEAEIRIPGPGPVVGYLDSTRASHAGLLPAGVSWEAAMGAAAALAGQIIDRDGFFAVDSRSGFIVCRGPMRS